MIDKLKNRFVTGTFVADVKQYFTKINEIIDYLNNQVPAVNYKIYRALMTQAGGDDPVVEVLENTLGQNINWVRSAQGTYTGTFNNYLPEEKTFLMINNVSKIDNTISFYRNGTYNIEIVTGEFNPLVPNFSEQDSILDRTAVEVIVYN